MSIFNPKCLGMALGAGLLATVALIPQAKGELVYEDGQTAAQIEDRTAMREAIGASEKAQVTLQAQAATPVEAPSAVMMSPAAQATATATVETQNWSKSELMRRERQREELKNEDLLQERLEELRLRDERRRTEEVLGMKMAPGQDAAAAAPMGSAALTSEVVMAPVTETGGQPALAPQMAQAPAMQSAGMIGAPVAASNEASMMAQSTMSVAPGLEGDKSERTMISVSPRAGLSNMVNSGGYFDVRPRFGAGVSAALGASDHFSFQAGYTFNQYGVSMASMNPFVAAAQMQAAMYGQSNFQSLNMNQNVFDAGVKVHLLSMDSKIRPFVGGGGAYARSYINFSSQVLNTMNSTYGANISPDYTVNNFLGFLSTGLEFKVSKSIFVGADFRYYAVLSESNSGYNNAYNNVFYGGYPGYGGMPMGVNPMNQDAAVAGNALSRNNFYSIMGNVTFTF